MSIRPTGVLPRWVGLSALGFALVASAACANSSTEATSPRPRSSLPMSAKPLGAYSRAVASNRERTVHETHRLLASARLPGSRTIVPSGPAALSSPVLGTPVTSSLIDTVRFWQVAMPFQRALAWISSHPPLGLTKTGSSTATGPGSAPIAGYGYSDRDTAAWTQAQLEIGVAPKGSGSSIWRVDGTALWLDPRPASDRAAGKRIHIISTAAGCPRSDRDDVGVRNGASGLGRALLAATTPTAALVCTYAGLNGAAFALTSHRRTTASHAARIAELARQVQLSHLDNAVTNCPMDDGSTVVIAFSYPHQPPVSLWYSDSGCPSIANGTIATGGQATGFPALAAAISQH